MQTQAVLTFGWTPSADAHLSASALLATITEQGHAAARATVEQAMPTDGVIRIGAIDHLFRRRPGGMQPLRTFVGSLGRILGQLGARLEATCECDAFAYAFLKRTHNFDLILPEDPDADGSFRLQQPKLRAAITALEAFERAGTPLPPETGVKAEAYLAMRRCLLRPTARRERLILANLLINGCSTLGDLERELGVEPMLLTRIMIGLVEHRVVREAPDGAGYTLSGWALPMVLFCLRETMGLDYLAALG